MASCCKHLGARFSVLAAVHIVQVMVRLHVPVNLQQEKCCFLFRLGHNQVMMFLYVSSYRQHSFTKGTEPA